MFSSGRLAGRTTLRAAVVASAALGLLLASGISADASAKTAPSVSSVSVNSGPSTGKTRVTITGSNLSHVTAVTFGGVKGTSITVAASHKSLHVTTPAHLVGAVDVRVKTSAGTSPAGSHDVFTYRTYSSISAGGYHSCAVNNGAVRCWGENSYGQLGNNTTTDSSSPVAVSGLAHVVAISGGESHTCALINDGTVRCWGYNAYGQLGNNTTTDAHTPVKVLGLSHVVAIGAGYYQTCAVISDGTARCWGDNSDGELGTGTTTSHLIPVKVSGLVHVTSISANYYFTCGLRSDGAAFCWGDNTYGQLGNGTLTTADAPVRVLGLSHATALSAGFYQACAVVSGTVRCWGYGGYGALGNGTFTNSSSATPVAGLIGVSALSVGGDDGCVLVRTHAFCWGDNTYGEVGDGDTTTTTLQTPAAVAALGSTSQLSLGAAHVLVSLSSGALRAWGYNFYGELGNGTTTNSALPIPVVG
jgi:alpha-tubulin suppressor-like RCC1 family protein